MQEQKARSSSSAALRHLVRRYARNGPDDWRILGGTSAKRFLRSIFAPICPHSFLAAESEKGSGVGRSGDREAEWTGRNVIRAQRFPCYGRSEMSGVLQNQACG